MRGHVLLVAENGKLELLGTDLTSWLRVSIACEDRFSSCLPLMELANFVKPTDRADRDSIVELTSRRNGQVDVAIECALTTIPSLPAKDYPRWPRARVARSAQPSGTWDAREFGATLGWVIRAVGKDETRRHLTGVLFDRDRVVAVDGHRLHAARLKGLPSGQLLLPSTTMRALLRVLPKTGTVTAIRMGDHVVFQTGGWEVAAKPMEEQFPPYEQVIPRADAEDFHTILEPELVGDALRRLPHIPRGISRGVLVRVNGQVYLDQKTDTGHASVTIPAVESTHEGKEFHIGIDGRYITDAIADGTDTITARFCGELDPVVIEHADGRTAVVMPMRL